MLRQGVVRLRKQSGMNGDNLAAIAGIHQTTANPWLAKTKRGRLTG